MCTLPQQLDCIDPSWPMTEIFGDVVQLVGMSEKTRAAAREACESSL